MNHSDAPRESNPFSTRYIRPGALPYLFSAGISASDLVDALRQANWVGQIIGPHGTGKSTLLSALRDPLAAAGRVCFEICLRDGQRRLPRGWAAAVRSAGANQIIVDGYEQLSLWNRWRLARTCRRQKLGLLVTTHIDLGWPTIATTTASLPMTMELVRRLIEGRTGQITDHQVAAAFESAGGNVREALFRLYDEWDRGHTAPSGEKI